MKILRAFVVSLLGAVLWPALGSAQDAPSGGPVTYNGGPIMQPFVAVYPIFWAPSTLQNGGAVTFSPLFGTLAILAAAWAPGHNPMSALTQYYQVQNGVTTYFNDGGGLGGYAIDTNAFPAAGCTNSATPGNCLTMTQIGTEVRNVLVAKGWTGGMTNAFMVYLPAGMGVCTDSTNANCAGVQSGYCSRYGNFALNGQTVLFAYVVYNGVGGCKPTSEVTSPNGDVSADYAAMRGTDILMSLATNPLSSTAVPASAWYDIVNDKSVTKICSGTANVDSDVLPNTWTNPANGVKANQMWNGYYFEIPAIYSNHTNTCVQAGP